MFARNSLLAALLVLTGVARSALACACAPCPLDVPGSACPGAAPPCCGEPEPSEPSCECAHLDVPDADLAGYDTPIPLCTMEWEAPVHLPQRESDPFGPILAMGPDPPLWAVCPPFLRDRVLRI